MNIKKIFAISTAAIMMFSAVASAAIPTKEELEARTPKIEVVVGDKITTLEGFKALSTAEYPDDVYADNKDKYDFYKVTMNLSDLGYLANIRGEIVAVSAVSLDIRDNDFKKDTSGKKTGIFGALDDYGDKISSGVTVNGGAAAAGYGLNEGYFTLSWAIKDNDVVYPASNTIENGTLSVDYVVAIEAGKSLETDDYITEITYRYGKSKTTTSNVGNKAATLVGGKFSIGATTPVVKDIAIDASAEATTATGYVWNVALTNAAKINEFKATFKADGAKDAVKYIRNIADVASAISGEGSLNFQVGVLTDTTTKTNATATFDVKDSDGKTASATVAAK